MPRGGGRSGRGGGGPRGPPLFDSPPGLMPHPPPMGIGGPPPGLMDTPPPGHYRGDLLPLPQGGGGGRGRGGGGKRRNRGGHSDSFPPAKKPATSEEDTKHEPLHSETDDSGLDNQPSSSKGQNSGQCESLHVKVHLHSVIVLPCLSGAFPPRVPLSKNLCVTLLLVCPYNQCYIPGVS